jgi:hypothetical protein
MKSIVVYLTLAREAFKRADVHVRRAADLIKAAR